MKSTAPSPVGKGMHARDTPVGKRSKGTDGNMWVVSQDKNGRHFWKKISKTYRAVAAVAPKKRKRTTTTKTKTTRKAKTATTTRTRTRRPAVVKVVAPKKRRAPVEAVSTKGAVMGKARTMEEATKILRYLQQVSRQDEMMYDRMTDGGGKPKKGQVFFFPQRKLKAMPMPWPLPKNKSVRTITGQGTILPQYNLLMDEPSGRFDPIKTLGKTPDIEYTRPSGGIATFGSDPIFQVI